MDLHPCARIGIGIMFDHATGIVIGETAVIGDNCSLFHNVTLGGTGKIGGDRHPKLGDNVTVGAGTQILGNIKIGKGTKIGAGSVVLEELPENVTAVGVPAKIVKEKLKNQVDNALEAGTVVYKIKSAKLWENYWRKNNLCVDLN